ncbi:MobF family relaxase [Mycolicibacterium gilvum]|uniref:TrwC relaxase n=1 Tax=Mycolicibacterium gilvum TaxID=1804 RepID=A0A378SNN3_9MYCO|nr:MobF family relaxase [Mycolicibacterium gilvum]MCV7059274.1 relaxase domain-containing protein [Mycolicibacterium gilvum]STZ44419.1 TrwC relaxase [Mycolicibacterium gilvum]
MVMTLHKLTAGDGYLYLVRQVAAADSTQRGRSTLADYYSAKGEAPGRWLGRGLRALSHAAPTDVSDEAREEHWTVQAGSEVGEEQMRALYGEGIHPNADRIMGYVAGRGMRAQRTAAQLGRRFLVYDGQPEFARRLAAAYRDYNAAAGRHWRTTIAAADRAVIRTRLAVELFAEQYGRPPADDRELSGFIARNTRARTTAVAGYDLTFSPVKSVSALWAIAPRSVSDQVEAAHDAAVADVLEWLQDQACFTRTGTGGVAQVDTEGLIAAAFTHRDSRAGDPDLHTHVAISNKVSHVDVNGVRRWLALDGQPLHRVTVAASELYNTRLEAHMIDRLAVPFVEQSRGRGKRPIREIDGISTELMSRWSSRRAAITARTAELAKQFQADHGREPTNVEIIALAQQATLESREAKHEPRSLAEQRHVWRTQAVEVLGRDGLHRMLAGVLTGSHRDRTTPVVDEEWVASRAGELIATVSKSRSTWQRHHVRAEALRIARSHGVAHDVALVERLTDTALGEAFSVPHARIADAELGEPVALRRRDSASVYSRHGVALYTSRDTLAAERRILDTAHRSDGRAATAADVELALADAAARGSPLNPGQAALVSEMATRGRRVALALAPAGTGKTTAMAVLAHAWRSSGGHVIGLAPTADAAIVLGADLGAVTDTLDKYVWCADPDKAAISGVPDWFQRVGPDTLIVVDEAGKAATAGLDAMITDALRKGASVRLVGDDGQLSSISAGGVLRDIAEATDALTLSEVVRFKSPAEAAAGLALHDADPAGIGFYIDHHRIHVGTDETAADMAYQAWRADLAAGADSILLAPTNDVINELNARARADRLAADPEAARAATVVLADQLHASVGDTIRTRKNKRRITIGRNDFVRNGYRYTITEVRTDGSVKARHLRSGRIVTLPADYIAEHVSLGYAATIDSAQGLTAGRRDTKGTCHIVGSDMLTRQHLYVAMTRATDENHLYLSTAEGDPHRLLCPKATHPDTAVDVLTRTLARDGAQVSATTEARRAEDPATRLQAAADMFYDALGAAAENQLSSGARDRLDAIADDVIPRLSQREAWPVLRRNLSVLAIGGADPRELLTEALAKGSVDDAADPAAVLDHRIDPAGTHSAGIGVLRWLPAIPPALADDPHWGAYLARREHLVEDLADQIRERARAWTNATAPAWARPLITVNPALTAEIAVFRAATGVEDADTRLTGARQYPVRTRAVQATLQRYAAADIGRRSADTTRWNDLIDAIDPHLRADAYWPQLATQLAQATRSTADLRQIITTAARQGPLPDELPAAALWWRIAGALSPTATLATTHSRLRPSWITDVDAVFGAALTETITSDPAWPGLVAAISAADPATWTPRDLLHVAAEHLADAADADHPIPPGDYARLITYTVDAFTHRLQARLGIDVEDLPTPQHAPPHPDEEALFPPDPESPFAEIDVAPPFDDHFDIAPPNYSFEYAFEELGDLQFGDLTANRPTPELGITMELVATLQQEYREVSARIKSLDSEIRAGNGPAMRAAADELLRMRHQVDADRPYALAVAAVMERWADADAAYNDTLRMIEHARTQLDLLRANPDADELDIASARRNVVFYTALLPEEPPSLQFQQALAQAQAARTAAAGGDKIVTEHDIVAARGDAERADLAARAQMRDRRQTLRRKLDRAERDVAGAFAAAQTATSDTLEQLLKSARSEVALLQVAGDADLTRTPLPIPPAALAAHEPHTADRLKSLAAQPYRLAVVRADTTDRETAAALYTLRSTANANDRKVLWLSTTDASAAPAREADLADTITTACRAERQISDQQWALPPGAIVIIDDPAAAEPDQLAEIAHHAAAADARVILLDPSNSRGPSSSALRLLTNSLPWNTTLTATPSSPVDPLLDAIPAVTLADRLGRTHLSESWRHVLTQYDNAVRAVRAAQRRNLSVGWRTPKATVDVPEHTVGAGVDD